MVAVPALLAVLLAVVACGAPTGREVRANAPTVATGDARDAVEPLNELALDVARSLASTNGNVAVTTYPLARSLAMARVGSRGETRAAFDRLLATGDADDLDHALASIEPAVRALAGERRSAVRRGSIELSMLSALWAQEGTQFVPELLETLDAYYDTGVRVVDFRSEPDEARKAINRWASDGTDGTLDLLVPRGGVTDFTRFVAASAGVVRAPWAVRFDPAGTRRSPFVQRDGQTVEVLSMGVRDRGSIRSASFEDWETVELPYLGGELAMLVVVPAPGRFDDVAAGFDSAALETVTEALTPRPIELRLPRFEFTSVLNLDEELGSLGLSDAFLNARADFGGVTGDEALHLSDVVHGTYVAADEEGSGEDAVTVVTPRGQLDGTVVRVTVDRPFLFFVRDTVRGLVLQVGRVLEPQQ